MTKLSILGATGSIGQSTLRVLEFMPGRFKVVALAAGRNMALLAEEIVKHQPELVAVFGPQEVDDLNQRLSGLGLARRPQIVYGPKGYELAAAGAGADMVLSALVGAAGLRPTWAAIDKGLAVALANKESLVLGGDLIMPLVKKRGGGLLPVDSEHSAIFQALGGRETMWVRRLILTASGGPFRGRSLDSLKEVTAAQALNHPRWAMGPKISCDSATMMNKGLEIIEAHHLFNMPYDKIEVLVHPQSVVHSIVEYQDGSQIAQMGPTDMRLAIAYALNFPERLPLAPGLYPPLELENVASPGLPDGCLSFEKVDEGVFKAVRLARQAGLAGGTAPAVLNGANEAAVEAFLEGRINFLKIIDIVEECLDRLPGGPALDIEAVLEADQKARLLAKEMM